ncbi:hypothetical protein HK100_006085 [Physocladia obscura]|uniref:Uncharacterized protein n=1 Tax=Physocladia obscura TaxID=109957 RepID=A0AAD5STH2_9FUNG|nr:hypothetical protein HK100_006085 [Physocladia obscura]
MTVHLSTLEKILSLKWSTVAVQYRLIKAVRTHPQEATKLLKGVKVGSNIPGLTTQAVYYHTDGQQPDLHLYANPQDTIAFDLEGHDTFGKLIIQVNNLPCDDAAAEVQQHLQSLAAEQPHVTQ